MNLEKDYQFFFHKILIKFLDLSSTKEILFLYLQDFIEGLSVLTIPCH